MEIVVLEGEADGMGPSLAVIATNVLVKSAGGVGAGDELDVGYFSLLESPWAVMLLLRASVDDEASVR